MIHTVDFNNHEILKKIIQTAVPNYRYDRIFVSEFNRLRVNNKVWIGDDCVKVKLIHIETLRMKHIPKGLNDIRSIPEGYVLVKAGVWDGSPAIAHVYYHPKNTEVGVKEEVCVSS